MKAVIKNPAMNGKNYADTKELVDSWKVCANVPGRGIASIVEARAYMGRSRNASMVYASVWVHAPGGVKGRKECHTAGHGTAGGYGYHKKSAAIGAALTSAGIELYGSPYAGQEGDETKRAYIGGCGDSSLQGALLSIARALGYKDAVIV